MKAIAPLVQPVNKKTVCGIMNANGMNRAKGLEQLASTGSLQVSAAVKITYCGHRYHLIDQGSKGGENIAAMVDFRTRALLPATQSDADGTYEQRQESQAEAVKMDQVRHALLIG